MNKTASVSHFYPLNDRVAVVPIEHKKLAYALEVRKAIFEYNPDVVLLELPHAIKNKVREAVAKLPIPSFVIYKKDNQGIYLSIDPSDARIEAIRLCEEYSVAYEFLDEALPGTETYQPLPDEWAMPDLSASRFGELIEKKINSALTRSRVRPEFLNRFKLHLEKDQRILVVCHAMLLPTLRDEVEAFSTNSQKGTETSIFDSDLEESSEAQIVKPQSSELPFLFGELPAITFEYERYRRMEGDHAKFSVDKILKRLINDAIHRYQEAYDERVNLTEQRALYQFARNLSLITNRLRPGLRELIQAAQGCVSDDFAAILLEVLTTYPPLGDDQTTFTDHYSSHHLYFDFGDGAVRLCSRYYEPEMGTLEFDFKRRQFSQQQKQAWRESFTNSGLWGICSWPPEDILIEKFFDHTRKRALSLLTDEHSSTEAFSTSMMDGLDLRETIRHWHDNKIYVKRERQPPGKVGPVVLVWRDRLLSYDDWKTTLYAENQNESDIAFCATPMGDDMIGPQISRSEYFSILSVYPSMGIPDVWQIPDLEGWRTCARLLTAAAILMSDERFVAVVSKHPPDKDIEEFARKHGRALIYLPLATFSRKTLRRLRHFHILNGKHVRGWAGDYIVDSPSG